MCALVCTVTVRCMKIKTQNCFSHENKIKTKKQKKERGAICWCYQNVLIRENVITVRAYAVLQCFLFVV